MAAFTLASPVLKTGWKAADNMPRGVEIRASSIRIIYSRGGKQERRTLLQNGQPLPPTPANIKYAERTAAEIREKIRLGMFSEIEYFGKSQEQESALTLQNLFNHWLDAQRIEPSTRAGYTSAIKFWCEALRPARIVKTLKPSDILKVVAKRHDLSGKTVNNYVSVLREALELAVRDEVLNQNPAAEVPRAKHQKEPPDPFSRDESDAIIEEVSRNFPGQVHNLIEFWAWTGLRTSEIFALRWKNVDLASGTILVSDAVVRGVQKSRTKTNTARTVKLNSRALKALQRQIEQTEADGGEVFKDPRYGTPWVDERAFRRSFWTPTLKSLGIRYRRPYNLRHTYATAMLMVGMTPAFCAKQLGHSVEMFLRTYSKWLDGAQNDLEMQRLEASLTGKLTPD